MSPTPSSEFPKLLDLAAAEAQAGTQELIEKFKLHEFNTVSLDLHVGRLNFSPEVRFDVQIIGSFDPKSAYWLWAWADRAIPNSLIRAAEHAHGFGKANEIQPLTTDRIKSSDVECWLWTAFATRLVKWPGMYRMPIDSGHIVYMSIKPVPVNADAGLIAPPTVNGSPFSQ